MDEFTGTVTAPYPTEYNQHLDNCYGVLCMVCFIFGTVGNAFALVYFIRKRKDVPTIIYTVVVTVDTLISIIVLPTAFSYFQERSPYFFESPVLCNIWAVMWMVLSRMSVFLVAILSITRAYSITCPFRIISKNLIRAVIGAAFLVHTLGSTIPLWYGSNNQYTKVVAACNHYEIIPDGAVTAMEVFDSIGITIPIPIIFLSFLQTVVQLVKKPVGMRGREARYRNNITATVTIALFTGIFLLFNVPGAIVILLYTFTNIILPRRLLYSHYLLAFYFMLIVPLNAACNPFLYFWRMRHMREELLAVVRDMRKLSSVSNTAGAVRCTVRNSTVVNRNRIANGGV